MKFNIKIPNRRSILLIFGLLLMLSGTSACQNQEESGLNSESSEPVNESVAGTTAQAPIERERVPGHPPKEPSDRRQVQVFFPETPDGDGQIDEVQPVWRTTDRIDVAEFAIEQLIAGPTPEEQQRGLMDELDLSGESNCGGENFTISISDAGEARLQFCRAVPTAGIGEDARIENAIEKTLKQFESVNSVTILNQYGDCFKDLSGRNLCLVDEDERQVKVFFPLASERRDSINDVSFVWRTTDRVDVAEFAIEQLIAGPTPEEKERGLMDEIKLSGESNCGGENFTISISDAGEARLQFCRAVPTAGIGEDARIENALRKTLNQFDSVNSVIILDKDGTCFKDPSGRNQCLQSAQMNPTLERKG